MPQTAYSMVTILPHLLLGTRLPYLPCVTSNIVFGITLTEQKENILQDITKVFSVPYPIIVMTDKVNMRAEGNVHLSSTLQKQFISPE